MKIELTPTVNPDISLWAKTSSLARIAEGEYAGSSFYSRENSIHVHIYQNNTYYGSVGFSLDELFTGALSALKASML